MRDYTFELSNAAVLSEHSEYMFRHANLYIEAIAITTSNDEYLICVQEMNTSEHVDLDNIARDSNAYERFTVSRQLVFSAHEFHEYIVKLVSDQTKLELSI